MSKKRKDEKIVISFLGGSRDDVTGSVVQICIPSKDGHINILCDLGMIQGSMSPEIEYSSNKKVIENIDVENIDYVFISHSHSDHTSLLPIMGSDKFNGKIFMDYQTSVITKDLLKDSVYLHDLLIKNLQSKGKRSKHLYDEIMMYKCFDKFEVVDKHKKIYVNENLSFELYESGHCLGSQIKFYITLPYSKQVKTIVYTGDLSSKYNKKYKPYNEDIEIIPKANCYIFEGTYGNNDGRNFNKKTVNKEVAELKKCLTKYLKEGKRIFFPCFSFARTEEILDLLYNMFNEEEWFKTMNIPVYVDGKLTNKIVERYSQILYGEKLERWNKVREWSSIRYNKEYKGTLNIISNRQCGIYLSSSGFIQPKTRSCEYVKDFLGSEKAVICFVGYYGNENSIGGQIYNVEKGKPIKIDGSTIIKSCNVIQFKSFSSHIQKDEILKYWGQINADKIIIHHASKDAKDNLLKEGKKYLMNIGKTTNISCVDKNNYQFVL